MTNDSALLEILAYRTRVHLGYSSEERSFPQEVELDIRLRFGTPPRATQTDALEDTICYATLCSAIDQVARARPFKLIESLAREIHDSVKAIAGPQLTSLEVAVHKLRPPIDSLRGGARFVYASSR